MSDPHLRAATDGQPDADVRRLRTIAAARPPSAEPETVATKSAPEHVDRAADDRGRASRSIQVDESLLELGTRFEGLTRVLDDIRQVSEGLPEFDVDSMTKPVLGVLKGVMGRIMNAPATTIVDLGIKAQVVMWSNQDWWEEDADLSWQAAVTKALIGQTIAAAGLTPPVMSGSPLAKDITG
jgi:hypothetical protein